MSPTASYAPDQDGVLVINAGSTSIKFAIYAAREGEPLRLMSGGEVEQVGTREAQLVVTTPGAETPTERRWTLKSGEDAGGLIAAVMDWVDAEYGVQRLAAAGHRVALGGLEHSAPVLLTDAILEGLRALCPLAPLHQPHNLAPIDLLKQRHPNLRQVACFDTAFHRTMPETAELYGLPRSLSDLGARRFGFHGLSYEYIAGELPKLAPEAAAGRTIVAHLGGGASLCALSNGRSVATTMGFSPLSGLVMATRPGELDAGLVLWLLQERNMSPAEVETMLYKESGLLGVSGISGDMRDLLGSDDPRAREAVDLFVYRLCREIGSLAAALGGLDALVFTAGIGEHAATIRAEACRRCAWLGVVLDCDANEAGGPLISAVTSPVQVWVIPTDEELMIARHAAALALADSAPAPA